jgi:hypothetical protein
MLIAEEYGLRILRVEKVKTGLLLPVSFAVPHDLSTVSFSQFAPKMIESFQQKLSIKVVEVCKQVTKNYFR